MEISAVACEKVSLVLKDTCATYGLKPELAGFPYIAAFNNVRLSVRDGWVQIHPFLLFPLCEIRSIDFTLAMSITECSLGHKYDAEVFPECPLCSGKLARGIEKPIIHWSHKEE